MATINTVKASPVKMKKYRFIGHTADVGLIAHGARLSEAFANAACGMFAIITNLRHVRAKESRAVEVAAEDSESLLFEWLNHLLYFFDAEMLLLKRFEITAMESGRLKATCYGEKYDPSRHKLKTGVKAATYHMLTVDKAKHQVQVIFDI
ncbi:archease [Chloroflexota bacterium]